VTDPRTGHRWPVHAEPAAAPDAAYRIDVYPVGWLSVLLPLRRAYLGPALPAEVRADVRRHAWARLRTTLRHTLNDARGRHWRSLANQFNGYLAEPTPIPEGMRRCGSGWTRRRALRSLQRHVRRPGVLWEPLDAAIRGELSADH